MNTHNEFAGPGPEVWASWLCIVTWGGPTQSVGTDMANEGRQAADSAAVYAAVARPWVAHYGVNQHLLAPPLLAAGEAQRRRGLGGGCVGLVYEAAAAPVQARDCLSPSLSPPPVTHTHSLTYTHKHKRARARAAWGSPSNTV